MIEHAKQRFEELKASGLLPSPKGVALAVLELTQSNDVSIQNLTHLVQTDPAMSGRVLKYANAAHGGSLRHIASLAHAIVFLGIFRVRQIALGFSLIDHYRSGACAAFDYTGYWTASLATGITAQHVARQAQCPPDETFTCGLLSGVGRLALATAFPLEYGELLERGLPEPALRAAETERFGVDHAGLSSDLLEDWGLPEIFHQAVRYQELPGEAPFPAGSRVQALTAALHLSARVGQLLNLDHAQRWEQVPALYHAAAQLGLEAHELPPLVEQVVKEWQDWGRELRLPTREFSDIRTLLSSQPQEGEMAALVVLPMRVALVAHSAQLLRTLADTLDAMGLRVSLAADRDGAQRLLRDTPTDLMMVEIPREPGRGVELLRDLRATEHGRQAYCIALVPPDQEAEVARLMLAGASDYLLTDFSEAALLARLNAAQRVVALQGAVRAERESTIRGSGEWARSNRRLMQEALTDPLTQVANRRYGLDRFRQEWSFAGHNGTPLTCMMLDVDHFKKVNDSYGHEVGDQVLAQVAAVIERVCRRNDVVFRYGGEEFCLVCPHTGPTEARLLGERLLEAVRKELFGKAGQRFHITMSIGLTEMDKGMAQVEALIQRADRALYAAKAGGRDRLVAWTTDLPA
ncbi:MAG TPA: diguanylate cyclase [Thiobacillaceae bacterium]|nr:diguanylate cyclase [Thiobacillaceae bacterium]